MKRSIALFTTLFSTLFTLNAVPAHAAIPDPVRAMIDAAIARGDEKQVKTVIDLARETNPADAAEINAIWQDFQTGQTKALAASKEAEREAIRQAGLFQRWTGKGEIGAFRATGNSDNTGLSLALGLTREGIDWSHKLTARADYQRSNGVTTREQVFAAYEPRYQIGGRLFAYGLGQYERDRFQGFSGRYAVSGGLGYKLVDEAGLKVAVKGGPAFRHTEFIGGGSEDELAALFAVDADWEITDRLTLSQDANMVADAGGQATVIFGAKNTTLNLVTALNAKVSDRLSTRLSYTVEYDSSPPPGAVSTDTLSRFTLVYGF